MTGHEMEKFHMRLALAEAEVRRLQLRDQLLDQLTTQIAVYFGRYGGLAVLQDGIHAGTGGHEIRCLACGGTIWRHGRMTRGHSRSCGLVADLARATEAIGGEGS